MGNNRGGNLLFLFFTVCILGLSLGQFSSLGNLSGGKLYLFDILIAVFDLCGLLYLCCKKKDLRPDIPVILLLTFSLLGGVSTMVSPVIMDASEIATSLSYLTRFGSYVLFALVIQKMIRYRVFEPRQVVMVILLSGVFLFIAGLIQMILLPDLETLDPSLGWDPHKNRMASTFFDPNFLGAYFVVCLALTLQGLHGQTRRLKRFVWPLIFLIGILLTFSRSAWVATSVVIIFTGIKNRLVLIGSVLIVLLAVFAIPRVQTRISGVTDPQDSASFRLTSWTHAWEIIQDNWVFGIGYNTFRYAQRDYGFLDDSSLLSHSGAGSDSSLLLVWATTGIIGLTFYLSFLAYAAFRVRWANTGLILALLIDSLFINSLFYPQILVVLLIMLLGNYKWWPLKGSNL